MMNLYNKLRIAFQLLKSHDCVVETHKFSSGDSTIFINNTNKWFNFKLVRKHMEFQQDGEEWFRFNLTAVPIRLIGSEELTCSAATKLCNQWKEMLEICSSINELGICGKREEVISVIEKLQNHFN